MAMLDVAMILMSSHVTGYLRNGVHPKPHGNRHPHATNGAFATKDGLVMLGASNLRQQRRLWTLLGRPDMIKRTNDERDADHEREIAVLSEIMLTRTADEWEEFLQARHVPAARVRTMGEAIADPQIASRGVIHRHQNANGIEGGFGVPLAAFTFAHGGPRIDTAPPQLGQHNDEILRELGLADASRARTRRRPDCSAVLRLLVQPRRRLWHQPGALARQRLAAGELPVALGSAPREGLPAVGPVTQAVAVPRRLHGERVEVELLPQRARMLHVFARRQRERRHRILRVASISRPESDVFGPY